MIVIFDFDGTIHKTELVYKPALYKTLGELGIDPNSLDYRKYIGMSPKAVSYTHLTLPTNREV